MRKISKSSKEFYELFKSSIPSMTGVGHGTNKTIYVYLDKKIEKYSLCPQTYDGFKIEYVYMGKVKPL